jgi:diguanylate cyclase (GGDEF)-like protein/PAS domain S-box-containing protein
MPLASSGDEVQRRARQLQAIAELGQAALTGVEVPVLVGQTCALVEFVLEPYRCSIVEDYDGTLSLRYAVGATTGFDRCALTDPTHRALIALVLESDSPVVLSDLSRRAGVDLSHLSSDHGVSSGAAVRISGRTRHFGVLEVLYQGRRGITEDELQFLKAVADLTASIIENSRDREALEASDQRFRAIIENSSDGIVLTGEDDVITYAGPSTARLLGYAEEELVGSTFASLLHPDDALPYGASDESVPSVLTRELRVRDANGDWRWVECTLKNLLDNPAVGGVVINYRDITERKDAEQQLETLAYRDSLTGLPNRFLFHDRIKTAVNQARRHNRGLAVLYLDLDRFKLVNDTLGHGIGDDLLQRVAERLETAVRAGDTIARLGGDEFAVILPDIKSGDDAGIVARKVLAALNEPFLVSDHRLYAPASIGVSVFPVDGEDAGALLKNADSALYRAKELGRNNVQLFTPAMNERYRNRLDIELRLRNALEHDTLALEYQPIIDHRSGTIKVFEALLRLNDDGPSLSPSIFVPVAEETGLITTIGEWVLSRICRDIEEWRATGLPTFAVSMNLSAHQMRDRRLLRNLLDTVEKCGLRANDFQFEVTESVALENLDAAITVLSELREAGSQVAVDDFGTGQSSLVYLKRLPIDIVKLDREFLRNTSAASDLALLGSIIDLVHCLDLYVIAEGIETREELQLLQALGCDGMQGYLFSPAMPAGSIAGYLQRPVMVG